MTHGFVLDGDGAKMSKSVGNVISPDDVIEKEVHNINYVCVCLGGNPSHYLENGQPFPI